MKIKARFMAVAVIMIFLFMGNVGVASALTATVTTVSSGSLNNTSSYGVPVTFTAKVTPSAATGTVTFMDEATRLGTGTLSSGTATFSTSTLSTGTHSAIRAVYSGDTNYAASTSLAIIQTVTTPTALPSFAPKVDYTTGTLSDPKSVAAGDFNGDGKLDLAVANNNGTVCIMLGNGDGTFQRYVAYAAGNDTYSVAVGDFNGDGKLDLAVTNSNDSTVSVLLGNGDGTFRAPVDYATGSEPSSVTVGDFNGDGKLDLAVANYNDNTVSVLLGNGDGTFQRKVDCATGSGPRSVAVGDFKGDGKLDLAVAGDSSVSILFGNGDGTFLGNSDYGIVGATSVAIGDFNGDGKLDLAIATITQTVSIMLGNGDGSFATPVDYTTGYSDIPLYSVATGDFNGDGKLDLVVINMYGTVSVLLGNGDGTFQSKVDYATGGESESVAVGDFNGDGKLDLAVAINNGTVSVLLGKALYPAVTGVSSSTNLSTYGQSVTFTATVSPSSATGTVNFMDGSTAFGGSTLSGGTATYSTSALSVGAHTITAVYGGDTNYAGSTSSGITQTVNKITTTTTESSGQNPSAYGQSVTFTATVSPSTAGTVTFMDGATTLGTGTLYSGTATFTTVALSVGSHTITAVYGGDTNDTGSTSSGITQTVNQAITATVTTVSSGSLNDTSSYGDSVTFTAKVKPTAATGTVTFMDGATTFGTGTLSNGIATYSTSALSAGTHSNIAAVYGGDTNYVGSTSVAMTQTVTKATALPLTFETLLDYFNVNGVDGPWSVAVGDFNGDGKLDLSVTNYNDNTVSILLGNGDGTFLIFNSNTTGNYPTSVTVGDFNGDGKLDLAVANYGSNTVSILLGNGDGTFKTHVDYATGSYPQSVAVGDFNGDGKLDLAVANDVTSGYVSVSVLLGNGSGTFQPKVDVDYAAGNIPSSVTVGDFNGDGKLDLALMNTGNNTMFVLLGNSLYLYPTVTTVSSSPNPSTFGQSVTFTTEVNPSAATGSVTIKDGATTLGTGTLSGGTATFSTSALSVGTHTITAVYDGDTNYAASTSSGITQTVNTSPTSIITAPAKGAVISGSSYTITGTASDVGGSVVNVKVGIIPSGGTPTWYPATGTTSRSYKWTLPVNGSYTIQAVVTDNTGNTATSAAVNVTVDNTLKVAITAPLKGALISAIGTVIKGTASDSGSGVGNVQVGITDSLGTKTWYTAIGTTSWSCKWQPTIGDDGSYAITTMVTDKAGNQNVSEVLVTVDTTPPTSAIYPLPPANLNGTTYTIKGTASDATSGVKNVQVGIAPSGGTTTWHMATGTTSWSYKWTLPKDGSYTIETKATDKAGNAESPTTSVNVKVDKTSPVVTITPLSSTTLIGTTATITGTASDAGSGVSGVQVGITPKGSTNTTWYPASGTTSWSYTWTLPTDGQYTIKAMATDNAGNKKTTAAVNVTVSQ
ncbi:MAG: FG-GAP-like repeat-containing protein [Nitrospirota bacterium]